MKKEKMVLTAGISCMLMAMVFMIVTVAAAISHTVNIGSTVSFQAEGKVNATVTMSHTSENAITLKRNSEEAVTSSTLTIGANDSATTGNFALGDLELAAADNATGNVTYSYTISIKNNYLTTDAATYKHLKVTFTPPAENSCVSVNYDENFYWTGGTDTKIVTIDPNTRATIEVVFTTDVDVSNTADMSCSFVLAADIPDIWDGESASTPVGEGTAQSPYLISNGAELKWVSDNVSSLSGKYYTQTKDIYLNDETFTFMPDTGLVHVTDGVNTCYLGTGVKGTTSFNTTASVKGTIYYLSGGTYTAQTLTVANNKLSYGSNGTINLWTSIGTSHETFFQGTYDGNSKTVSGTYMNNTSKYQGLFGYNKGTIKNVGVVNSYIKSDSLVGGVCGYNSSPAGTITNCYNTGTVTGMDDVGGVCGDNNNGTITNCYNTGDVIGTGNNVGGVCGENKGTITNCYNTGDVIGTDYVGGVCGRNQRTITNCYYLSGCATDGNGTTQYGTGNETQGSTTADTSGVTTGLTLEQMTDEDNVATNYSGWDFENTWAISASVNNGLPYLR